MKVQVRILGQLVAEVTLVDEVQPGDVEVTLLDKEVKQLSKWWTRRMVK
jgi:hypothetical protein